jgi:uncharacterized membrane protein YdfJ with MMPL/SSD domain
VRRLTNWSARHPWRVLAVWGVAVLVGIALTAAFIGDLTTESEVTNNPESEQAYELIGSRIPFDPDEEVNELIVVHSPTSTADDPAFTRKVIGLAESIRQEGAVVAHHSYEEERGDLISQDRHAALITVGLIRDAESDLEDVIAEVERADGGGFDVSITGEWSVDRDLNQLSQDDLREGELMFGLPVAFIVLLLVFGTIVAGLIPVLMAIISIVVALGLTALLGQAFELSIFTVNMLTGMGLALGIDYSLFVISRFREERAQARAFRRDRRRLDHSGSRRRLLGPRLRVGNVRDGARPRHDPSQPRRGRNPRRHRLCAGLNVATAGAARADRRTRQRIEDSPDRSLRPSRDRQ